MVELVDEHDIGEHWVGLEVEVVGFGVLYVCFDDVVG